jgi:hypothetical protein
MFDAMLHDLDESLTGDIPSTAKPHQQPFTKVEGLLKVADKIEAIMFLDEEAVMGNSSILPIKMHVTETLNNLIIKLTDGLGFFPKEELYDAVNSLIILSANYMHPTLMEESEAENDEQPIH